MFSLSLCMHHKTVSYAKLHSIYFHVFSVITPPSQNAVVQENIQLEK